MEVSIFSALVAGFLMFFMPCTFPLVPIFLSTISGASLSDLKGKKELKHFRRKMILNSIAFVLGFTFIFTCLGIFSTALIKTLGGNYRFEIGRIAGVFVIAFGIFIILNQFVFSSGKFNNKYIVRLQKSFKLKNKQFKSNLLGSFLVGATFAFGWTPCIGPILGSIIALASTSESVIRGGLLLMIFSIGLAIPFLSVAIAASISSKALLKIKKFNRFLNTFSLITGLFLILIGVLLLTGMYYEISGRFFQVSLSNVPLFQSLLDYF